MSRAHFEVTIAMHRKVLMAGNGGTGLWFRLTCWCREHLTDGHVPRAVLFAFATDDQEVERAVLAGLIDVHEDGEYWIHDYLKHNHTKKKVEKIRKERQKAGAHGGKQKASKQPSKVPSKLLGGLLPHAPTPSIPVSQYPRSPDPPLTPQAKSDPKPRPRGLFGTEVAAFAEGMSAGLGRGWVSPSPFDSAKVSDVIAALCPGDLTDDDALEWVRASATEFGRFCADDADEARFMGGETATGWARWHNAGRPQAGSGRASATKLKTAPNQPRAPYHPPPKRAGGAS